MTASRKGGKGLQPAWAGHFVPWLRASQPGSLPEQAACPSCYPPGPRAPADHLGGLRAPGPPQSGRWPYWTTPTHLQAQWPSIAKASFTKDDKCASINFVSYRLCPLRGLVPDCGALGRVRPCGGLPKHRNLPAPRSVPALALPPPAAASSVPPPRPTPTRESAPPCELRSASHAPLGALPGPLLPTGPCCPWEPQFPSHLLGARPCATASPACEEHSVSARKTPGWGAASSPLAPCPDSLRQGSPLCRHPPTSRRDWGPFMRVTEGPFGGLGPQCQESTLSPRNPRPRPPALSPCGELPPSTPGDGRGLPPRLRARAPWVRAACPPTPPAWRRAEAWALCEQESTLSGTRPGRRAVGSAPGIGPLPASGPAQAPSTSLAGEQPCSPSTTHRPGGVGAAPARSPAEGGEAATGLHHFPPPPLGFNYQSRPGSPPSTSPHQ